ncbi:EGF-like repeat and discoidin I-like domain-containing protein 3 [Centruroides sculpturatus]|uniref:EGF-like repeat and discoidin I-like domain-containing protein 3 n=1 Tax=Centruroides sculpturatus TaxID=218467 RepID=UPI000C6D7A59|nr:EGF-like repeat and discoidin I-like domain-containing protein 3 [Centruroides sculpturatus]
MHLKMFSYVIGLVASLMTSVAGSGCSKPLGMMNGAVEDWQISSSSALSPLQDPGCGARHARLLRTGGFAWCPGHPEAYEWLQVDFGVPAKVTGILTQGRGDGRQWVTLYLVSHSMDAYHWKYCSDIYGKRKLFKGNIDSHSIKHSYLQFPITARFLRIHVMEWHKYPSMRMEIIGCQECNEIISLPPRAKMSASSSRPWKKQRTCTPDDAYIYGRGSWCARHNDVHQWLQVDLGPPTMVTGIVTKGRADSRRKQWVTSYTLSYSNNSVVWYLYKEDSSNNPQITELGGNMDKDTERRHYLNRPFVARYIRIHPTRWKGRLSMRVGIIGCLHTGACPPGFMRLNEDTECVENLAYKRETWVNDKRHAWHGWKYGHSSLAVDGDADATLQKCAILDNYYVDHPAWMVDLGEKRRIRGLVVTTWQGKGQDRANLYGDYLRNLDKLTAYVENKAKLENVSNGGKCSSVSRLNSALFRRRLHFECSDDTWGRYVYIKASGIANGWSRLFLFVLCEVTIY